MDEGCSLSFQAVNFSTNLSVLHLQGKINRGGVVQQGLFVPTRGTCQPAWQVNELRLADAGGRSTALDLGSSKL